MPPISAAPPSPPACSARPTAPCSAPSASSDARLRQADRRHRQRLQHDHALQRRPRRARAPGRERPCAAAGAMPQIFGTITVSDGISMGTEGMKYSLVSREVIADSIETACGAQSMDGVLAIGGCDKNMPGAMIAIARMNIPAIFVYGGTIKPGHCAGRDLTVVSAFEAVGQHSAGRIDDARAARGRAPRLPRQGLLRRDVHRQHDVVGVRGDGDEPPVLLHHGRRGRREGGERGARPAEVLVRRGAPAGSCPRQILTRKAFENGIAVAMALGGSHQRRAPPARHRPRGAACRSSSTTSRRSAPGCRCSATSSRRAATSPPTCTAAGGVPQVMKMLLEHGLLHGDALTDHRRDRRGDAGATCPRSRAPIRT